MQTESKKQPEAIVEAEVCFKIHDIDTEAGMMPGSTFGIWWNTGGEITPDSININDFVGWMYETGRIDNYHTEGNGLVEIGDDYHEYDQRRNDFIETRRGTFHYTFRQFIRDCVTDRDFITYKTCQV